MAEHAVELYTTRRQRWIQRYMGRFTHTLLMLPYDEGAASLSTGTKEMHMPLLTTELSQTKGRVSSIFSLCMHDTLDMDRIQGLREA